MIIYGPTLQNPVKARNSLRRDRPIGLLLWLLVGSMVLVTGNTFAGTTALVSVNNAGEQGNASSNSLAISANGRFVVFHSDATNLVPGDTNGKRDIFVRDRQKRKTTRVSVSSTGEQANDFNSTASISADGRFVAFGSGATNLVPGDTNSGGVAFQDVFVHDRQTGETTRVSVSSTGAQADKGCGAPAISADGRLVVFESSATTLVSGDTNGLQDIFLHDRQTGITTRVSVNSSGDQAMPGPFPFNLLGSLNPAISGDGRFVAFTSYAQNLVPGDTNGRADVFVHGLETGITTRVSVNSLGFEGNKDSFSPHLSADGRIVAFGSEASNLVAGDTNGVEDAFVYDFQTGELTRVSVSSVGVEANAASFNYAISADGRFVSFDTAATNLVPGDTNGLQDIFVHDRESGETIQVSVDRFGNEGNGESSVSPLSRNGRFVAFGSEASNLVAGDTNGVRDSFIYDSHSRKGAKGIFFNEGQDNDTEEGTDRTGDR